MKIRKNISLEDNILDKGLAKAKENGVSFSAYITNLINADTKGIVIEVKKTDEEKDGNIPGMNIPDEIMSDIDDIIG